MHSWKVHLLNGPYWPQVRDITPAISQGKRISGRRPAASAEGYVGPPLDTAASRYWWLGEAGTQQRTATGCIASRRDKIVDSPLGTLNAAVFSSPPLAPLPVSLRWLAIG